MTVLETRNLSKIYGGSNNIKVRALNNINLKVKEGEFVGVMGPSGSGKSTLLNILATIDSPTSGDVYIDGENIHNMDLDDLAIFRRRNLGFIFQEFNLLDTLTIKENISLPLILEGQEGEIVERKIKKVADILNIIKVLDKRTYQVSGGQQQRAAAARAIIGEPRIILADEPTGNLDSKSSYDLMSSLKMLNVEKKATIVMVTHDAFAASFCERIVVIKDGIEFLQVSRGDNSRRIFFNEILDALSLLGGGNSEGF